MNYDVIIVIYKKLFGFLFKNNLRYTIGIW